MTSKLLALILIAILLVSGCVSDSTIISDKNNVYLSHHEQAVIKNNIPQDEWGEPCSCIILTNRGETYSISGDENCVKAMKGATVDLLVKKANPGSLSCDVYQVTYLGDMP